MWPFKTKPVQTFAEYAAKKEPAPCGSQETHYYWTEVEGWSCPVCAGIKKQKKEEEDENRMVEKIAEAIVKKMREKDVK